jgi:virginiamycin B lyase
MKSVKKLSLPATIATIAIASGLAACTTSSTTAGRAQEKSTSPRVVQASAAYPGWAVFSPVGDEPILAIAAGFSTHVWLAQTGLRGAVLRVAFDGSYDTIAMPSKLAAPVALAAGPNGDMWVSEWFGKIGEIRMPDGPIREFSIGGPDKDAIGLTMGPDRNLWFVTRDGGAIGKMTSTGATTEYQPHLMNAGEAIAAAPGGEIWFCGFSDPGRSRSSSGSTSRSAQVTGITGKVSPAGAITEYPVRVASGLPFRLAVGGDGNVWVAVNDVKRDGHIVRVTPSGSTTAFAVRGNPRDIVTDGRDKLDFTIDNASSFGEITLDGHVSTLPLPGGAGARATSIAVASNGDEWFVGSLDGKSAVFVRLPSKIDVTPVSVTLAAPGASQKLTVSEKKYAGKWKVQSSDDGIVDVTKGKTLDTFTVVAISDGTCIVTIADKKGNSVTIPVTVK